MANAVTTLMPLPSLNEGDLGVISQISLPSRELDLLSVLGIYEGSKVRVLRNRSNEPLILLLRGTRIMVSRSAAGGILISHMVSQVVAGE